MKDEAYRMHVYVAINGERDYQDEKHGNHRHTMPEWITIIEGILGKAKAHFAGGKPDCEVAMRHEMRKVAASAVACMEQNGIEHREDQPKCDVCGDSAVEHATQEGYDHEFGGLQPIAAIMQSDLRKSIEQTLNRFSAENGSNTPDFILAQFLIDSLGAWDKAVAAREKWYGREPKPVPPDQCPPRPDVVGKPFLSSI